MHTNILGWLGKSAKSSIKKLEKAESKDNQGKSPVKSDKAADIIKYKNKLLKEPLADKLCYSKIISTGSGL